MPPELDTSPGVSGKAETTDKHTPEQETVQRELAFPVGKGFHWRFLSRVLWWIPLFVPVLYLTVLFAIQPATRMGPPEGAEWLDVLVYDDADLSAFILRGLNGYLGRTPGRIDQPELLYSDDYAELLEQPQPPLAPRYFLEHQHAVELLFRLGFVWQSPLPTIPSTILDGHYANIAYHTPTNEEQRELFARFRWAGRVIQIEFLVCLLGMILVLRLGYDREGKLSSSGWLLLLPASLYFAINRYDAIPAFLTTLSLACLGRSWRPTPERGANGGTSWWSSIDLRTRPQEDARRTTTTTFPPVEREANGGTPRTGGSPATAQRSSSLPSLSGGAVGGVPPFEKGGESRVHFPFLLGSAILMGAATLTKLYPILLAPIILRYLWPERRACFLWGTAYASTGALFLLGLYLAYDLEAVLGPVRWQTGHREVYGPTIYDVLTYRLAANDWVGQLFRRGVVLGTLCLLLITRPVNLASVLRRGAIILIVFMSLAVFYSPQWLLWLMPLLLPLTRSVSRSGHTGWVLVFLIVVMDLFTFWTVPVDYWEVSSAVFISRFLILIVVGLPLLRGHQTPKDTMPDRDQSGSPSLPPVLTSQ